LPWLLGEHVSHGKQVGDAVDAQYPGPPEGGIEPRMSRCSFAFIMSFPTGA
jgi:hypothetical protein